MAGYTHTHGNVCVCVSSEGVNTIMSRSKKDETEHSSHKTSLLNGGKTEKKDLGSSGKSCQTLPKKKGAIILRNVAVAL